MFVLRILFTLASTLYALAGLFIIICNVPIFSFHFWRRGCLYGYTISLLLLLLLLLLSFKEVRLLSLLLLLLLLDFSWESLLDELMGG